MTPMKAAEEAVDIPEREREYRRPIAFVGPPGDVVRTRWSSKRRDYLPIRAKTPVALSCGHGTEWERTPRGFGPTYHVPADFPGGKAVWISTKEVYPTLDMDPAELEAMVAAGKQPPRPIRSLICEECRRAYVERAEAERKTQREAELAEWKTSGAEEAFNAQMHALSSEERRWEELSMAVMDLQEAQLQKTVDKVADALGIDGSCIAWNYDDEGGLGGPSESEKIEGPPGRYHYCSVYTDEDLATLGRRSWIKTMNIELSRDQLANLLLRLGVGDVRDVEVSISTDEVLARQDELLAAE